MPPELHVLGLAVVCYGLAYWLIFPRLERKTLPRLALVDGMVTLALLAVAGFYYLGTGTRFSIGITETYWWVFTLLAAAAVEIPLLVVFYRRWGIDLFGDD